MLTLLAIAGGIVLAQAEPPPPPAPAADPAAPAAPAKPSGTTREICTTKVLSPKEKKSCCKSFPDLCAAPAQPPG